MDSSIVCGLLSGGITLAVCLINNTYSMRKERNAHDEKTKEQMKLIEKNAIEHDNQVLSSIQQQMERLESNHQNQIDTIVKQVNDNMTDVTARIEEIIANQEASHVAVKKDIDHLTFCLHELDKKIEKHNNVIERTFVLEKQTEVQEEKLKVVNHRIDDLEKQNAK